MASIIKEFNEACRLLGSDKVSERRKQIQTLKFLLNNAMITEYLNNNSDKQEGLTWDLLFDSVKCCVQKEAEAVEKDNLKPLVSTSMLSAQDRRKKDCMGILRLVVAKANIVKPRLKTAKLIDHIRYVMGNEFQWDMFSSEYSSLIDKHVLGSQIVMSEVKPTAWNEFIKAFVELYRGLKPGSNYGLTIQIIQGLVTTSASQSTLNSTLLFDFFRDAVKQCRDKNFSGSQQSQLLSACNSFCSLVAADCRLQLCHLGEDIAGVLLALLDDSCSKQLKSIIIRFLSLQMSCHHPGGATTQEEGMVAIDEAAWKKTLHRLYGLLLGDLQQSSLRTRLQESNLVASTSLVVSPDFLELLVNVGHQKFNSCSDEDGEPCGATKKRRLNRIFDSIVDQLHILGANNDVAANWLQFLSALLRKYPDNIANLEDFRSLLQLLNQFQLDCKRYLVMSHILECIDSALEAFIHWQRQNQTKDSSGPLLLYWKNIYEVAVRTASVNQCIPEVHAVIQGLVGHKIICVGHELQLLFSPGVSPLSSHSIRTLAFILNSGNFTKFAGNLRQSYKTKFSDAFSREPCGENSSFETRTTPFDCSVEFRFQLLDWLLPNFLEEVGNGSNTVSSNVCMTFDANTIDLLGEILTSLTLTDCNVISIPTPAPRFSIISLEDNYLRTSFCSSSANPELKQTPISHLQLTPVLPKLRDKVLELLHRDVATLLDSSLTTQSDSVGAVGYVCCLVIKFLGSAIQNGVLAIDELARGRLCDILQNLVLKLARDTQALYEKERFPGKTQALKTVLAWLHHFCSWEGNSSIEHRKTMMQFCREMVPEKFVDVLVDMIYEKEPAPTSVIDLNDLQQGRADSYDPEFGDMPQAIFDEDSSFAKAIREAGAAHPTESASENLFSKFGENWELADLKAKAVGTLAALCRYSRAPLLSPLRHPAAARDTAESHHSVQSRLLEPMTRPKFKPDSAKNAPLAFAILSELVDASQQLNEHHIEVIIDVLRLMCRSYFKDGERSNALLGVVAKLVPKLETVNPEIRLRALRLVKGFWDCREKSHSCPLVELGIARVLVALSKCSLMVFQEELATGDASAKAFGPELLLRYINSSNHLHAVASYSAKHLTTLMRRWDPTTKTLVLKPMQEQKQLLEQVLSAIEDSAVAADGYLTKQDLQCNWTAISLAALTRLAVDSSACLKPVLFAMVKHTKEVPNSRATVKRAIGWIAAASNYPTPSKFLAAHMGYLVQQCLEKKCGLGNFLWELDESQTLNSFVRLHYQVILPHAFALSDTVTRDAISDTLGRPWRVLVEECFPQIMTFILPGFALAANGGEGCNELREPILSSVKRTANTCHKVLEEILKPEVVNGLLHSKLDEVVISLLGCLYDSCADCDTSIELPPPNPPYFTRQVVAGALQYIMHVCNAPEVPLVSLLSKTKDGIQKILLSLHEHLQNSIEDHEIHRRMSMYCLFVGLVMEQLETGLGGSWAFVLQDVIHTLTQQVTRFRLRRLSLVTAKACLLLHDVVGICAAGCIDQLTTLLPTIVDCLIPVATDRANSPKAAAQAFATLNRLIFEHGDKMKAELSIIETFPDLDPFLDIRRKHLALKYEGRDANLKEEVQLFLKRLELPQVIVRAEGLQQLKHVLATKKDELLQYSADQESAYDFDKNSENFLYELVMRLLSICKSYPPKSEIVLQAAMCLGEIGPIPFPTVILKRRRLHVASDKPVEAFAGNTTSQRYLVVFRRLHAYVIGSDVATKSVASQVLKQILRTKSGHDFSVAYGSKKIGYLFHYLSPFASQKQISPGSLKNTNSEQGESYGTPDAFEDLGGSENSEYEIWLCKVVGTLIDMDISGCDVLQKLRPICDAQVDICEELLPLLAHAILLADNKNVYRSKLSKWIDSFFAKFCSHLDYVYGNSCPLSSQSSVADPGPIFMDKRAIKIMLAIVQHLRLQERPKVKGQMLTTWDNNFWLDINYFNVSKAADHCGAHFTALLFFEIWCDVKLQKCEVNMGDVNQLDSVSALPIHENATSKLYRMISSGFLTVEEQSAAQDLLLQINQNIGDPDAMYGCQMSRLANQGVRLKYYVQESQWDRALCAGDLALQNGTLISSEGLLQTMHKMGLNHLSQLYFEKYLDGSCATTQLDAIREHQSLCAWKMAKWSLPSSREGDSILQFNGCVFQSLLSLRNNATRRFQGLKRQACELVIEELRHGSLESTNSLHEPLTHLALVSQLEDGHRLMNNDCPLAVILKKWSNECAIVRRMNNEAEMVNGLRCSILQLLQSSERQQLKQPLVDHLVQQIRLARENGLQQWSEMYIARLREVPDIRQEKMVSELEEAKIFWERSEHEAAKSLLSCLIRRMDHNEVLRKSKLYGQVLGTYGNWLIETRTENATVVLENFLEKSISILKKFDASGDGDDDTLLSAYLSTARYADAQYQRAHDYMESSVYKVKQEMISQSVTALQKLNDGSQNKPVEVKRTMVNLKGQINIDRREVQTVQESKKKFLIKAIQSYIDCLRHGEKHNTRVFRLISLWFANNENRDVNVLMKNSIQHIQSRKFLPLIYQLAARMNANTPKPPFQTTLLELIERVTTDHPYHTLNILFALSNSSKDSDYLKHKRTTSRRTPKKDEEDRVLAAKGLLERMTETGLGPVIGNMSRLCNALISFAYWQPANSRAINEDIAIPNDQQIKKLEMLDQIPPFTLNIPVDATCAYQNIPSIVRYKSHFRLCGGNSVPKMISCVASDGQQHVQLVKGNDDLRQDAVMQQVFGIVNCLLKSNPETRCRQLSICTYKVIPLSQLSGVLEWCHNTEPISIFLVGSPPTLGAHQRYNPKDWSISACREKIKSAATGSLDNKYNAYTSICNHLKPVFHHFFLENFPEPPVWYERRTAYIKSVAVSSIVSYILGLGDRHVSNILINKRTAEFVHIDFGIAFEQGKNLITPETVPFRLTRDVVDGMGVMGTEGIFRRCCEKTMELMRESQEVILTILEVFLYDPLYQWTLSPIKVSKLQGQTGQLDKSTMETNTSITEENNCRLALECQEVSATDTNINKLAERVLVRLQDKLQGKEDGTMLSVSGQVSHLIQEAVDAHNLCRLFHGWQAYL